MSHMTRSVRSVAGCAAGPAVEIASGYQTYNGNSVPMPLAFAR